MEKLNITEAIHVGINPKTGVAVIGLEPGMKSDPVREMAILCEGLVLIIKHAHKDGVKDESDSMRDCIKHLKAGFVDGGYKVVQ